MNDMIVGVDYSINGPGMTIWIGNISDPSLSLENFKTIFANVKQKNEFNSSNCIGYPLHYKEVRGPTERAYICSTIFKKQLKDLPDSIGIMTDNCHMFFEDYGYGGYGLTQLAEHCAALKQEFYSMYLYNLYGIAPASIKKLFAKDKKVKGSALTKEEVHKGLAQIFGLESLEEWIGMPKKSHGFYDITDSMALTIFGITLRKVQKYEGELGSFWSPTKQISKEEIKYILKYEPSIL
jgi:hypothetical protein